MCLRTQRISSMVRGVWSVGRENKKYEKEPKMSKNMKKHIFPRERNGKINWARTNLIITLKFFFS